MLSVLAFWILDPLYNTLGAILAAFYSVVPSFGVAIILLTATVSLIRMPLVAKQVKSQQAMQRLQPEIKRLQAKHRSDPQKRNEELMRVYKENNVNPLAGCLPLLLQMPLFIVLYRLILDLSDQPPKHLPIGSSLMRALEESGGAMKSFGMDLADRASDVSGVGSLLPYALLIVLVVGTGLFQARQMQARMPKDAINSQMQIIGKVFPIVFGVISFSIPAGVVLYFVISNVWQIGQQAFMFRHGPPGGAAAPAVKGKEKGDPSADGAAGKASGRAQPRKGGTGRSGSQASGTGRQRPGPSKAGGGKGGRAGTSKTGTGRAGGTPRSGGKAGGKPGGANRSGRTGRVTPPRNGNKSSGNGAGRRQVRDQRKDG